MFYVRKPTRVNTLPLRVASAKELHNYKNRFIIADKPSFETDSKNSCCHSCTPEELFANELFFINCELDV